MKEIISTLLILVTIQSVFGQVDMAKIDKTISRFAEFYNTQNFKFSVNEIKSELNNPEFEQNWLKNFFEVYGEIKESSTVEPDKQIYIGRAIEGKIDYDKYYVRYNARKKVKYANGHEGWIIFLISDSDNYTLLSVDFLHKGLCDDTNNFISISNKAIAETKSGWNKVSETIEVIYP